MGASAAGLGDALLRKFSVPPYIVFYLPKDGRLSVVRVIHSSMDLTRQRIVTESS